MTGLAQILTLTLASPLSATAPAAPASADHSMPQNEKSVALATFGLVGSPELKAFLEGVQGRLGAEASKQAGKKVNGIKKATMTGTRLISELPDVDKDEKSYRTYMSKESQKFAKQSESVEAAIEAASGSDTDFAGSQLHKEAQALAELCKFHVCFFAALTLYRNPTFGRKTKPALEMLDILTQVLQTVSDREATALTAPAGAETTPDMLNTIRVEVCKAKHIQHGKGTRNIRIM